MNTNANLYFKSAPVPAGAEDLKAEALRLIMQLPPLERELILRDYRTGAQGRQIS